MNKIKLTTLSTMLLLALSAVAEETATLCPAGKCVNCDITDGVKSCSKCYKSSPIPAGSCQGSSTGIDNCLVALPDGNGGASCDTCEPGYHHATINDIGSCYPDSERTIENCVLELKYQDDTTDTTRCEFCANGFKTAGDGESCEPSPENPNCLGSANSMGSCSLCMPDYYREGSDGCFLREGTVQTACETAKGAEGELEGSAYCRVCNYVKGYFATDIQESGEFDQVCTFTFERVFSMSLVMINLYLVILR